MRPALLALLLLPLPACTGIEPAAIGAGYGALQAGVTYVRGVDAYSFEPATYDDVLAAARAAADRIGVTLLHEREAEDGTYELNYQFRGDSRLAVTIRRETDQVTSIKVNTKKKHNQGMAALFLRALFRELAEAGAYPMEWTEADEAAVESIN